MCCADLSYEAVSELQQEHVHFQQDVAHDDLWKQLGNSVFPHQSLSDNFFLGCCKQFKLENEHLAVD